MQKQCFKLCQYFNLIRCFSFNIRITIIDSGQLRKYTSLSALGILSGLHPLAMVSRSHALTENFLKTTVAVWLVILFFKCALVKLLKTESTDKVLRVKLPKHGRNATSCNRFRTTSAQRAAFCMVMCFAIRKTFMIKERTSLERLTTVLK